jgi:DNA processing protein
MKNEKLYQVALSLIPNIGPVLSRQLINHFATPEEIFRATRGKLSKISGIGEKLSKMIPNEKIMLKKAEQVISNSEKAGIKIHYYKEKSFPARLHQISDSPIVLYSKGNVDLNGSRNIGIVGTRKATQYGLEATEEIIQQAKFADPTIISGLAYGIDIKSHKEALKAELPTIAVLACGVDSVYPTRHRSIAEKMLENGGLVSEYPIGTTADPRFFPARNRIIAALSDAVIVVEAAKRGGALITGNIAFSYDRAVFAVPGDLKSAYSEGCNNLIKQLKASIYTSFKDISETLNWDIEDEQVEKKSKSYEKLTGNDQKVVQTLLANKKQMHLDQLSWQSQIPLSQLAGVLLQLEFSGMIKPLPGKEYRLI